MGNGLTSPRIFLFSSNARAKYFEDCLQALMLPRDMVLHFRYRVEHFDPEVLALIKASKLVGERVVVCYLYQEYLDGKWVPVPKQIRPLRVGKIVDVQENGPAIHIYFTVDAYPQNGATNEDIIRFADAALRKGGDKYRYVAIGNPIASEMFSSVSTDSSAFAAVVDTFTSDELRAPADDVSHQLMPRDPLFLRVDGLYKRGTQKQAVRINPTPLGEFSERERGYTLTDDSLFELRVQFYQPKWSQLDRKQISLAFKADKEHFAVPQDERILIGSLYDEGQFYVLPARDNTGWVSRLDVVPEDANQKPLENAAKFSVLVHAKPRVWPLFSRAVDALSQTVAIWLAGIATIVAFSTKSSAATAASASAPGNIVFITVSALALVAFAIVVVNAIVNSKVRT